MSVPRVSVQLIIFGERNRTDIEGVLNDVANAGYAAIEAGNLFETYGEDATHRMLANSELQVSGAHFGADDFEKTERLKSNILYAHAVGIKDLMCSSYIEKSVEGYKKAAAIFNQAGKTLVEEGLHFNYHNHAWEFDDIGGVTGMEVLAQETNPDYVKFNVDVFWVWYAGGDPTEFIRKYKDRMGYFHFKDGTSSVDSTGKRQPDFCELGRGEVDLKAAFQAATEVGARWITTEQDNTKLTPLESIKISRDYLQKTLGI